MNLIQSFAMVSIKLHAYLRDLPFKMTSKFLKSKQEVLNTISYFVECVEEVIKYCCKLVRLKKYPDLIKRYI